ncbi:MAG: sigma-70 family RNA polymerase sigma factor, partial [Myxococcales bacterium]
MTAKADAKKRAKPAPRSAAPRRAAHREAGTSEGASAEGGTSEGAEEPEEDSELLGDDREVFDTEAEVIDAADAEDSDEEREPGEEADTSSEVDPENETEAAGERGLARFDALQAYMREVQRHPLLSADEEHKLAVQYKNSEDRDVAARLVTANLRLVVKIAYEYRRAYRNMMDLVQEGNIGLMQAVKRYDPYRGVKLSSYAAWWIRAYMLRFILNNWRLVKVGTTQAQRKLFFNLNKEKAKLAAMGVDPTAEVIAARLGVEEQEVTDMDRRLLSGEMSLDAPVGDNEGRPVSRLEMMPSAASGPDVTVAANEIQQMLREKL